MQETEISASTQDTLAINIEQIRQIFPEIVCEKKIDFEKLKQILGEYVEENTERYNFTWNGKGQALKLSQTLSLGTLRPCVEESKNFDTTENLYIEGDNLEVLKLLQKSYYSKVKMIYIDPPYNTGNDFIYPDDYKDTIQNYLELSGQVDGTGRKLGTNTEANGRFHTDWLNMLYPRLRLARNLLTEDGVIFISIDDNEVHNLRKICDEVFGAGNFVNQIVWINNITGRQISGFGAAKTFEYILIFAKNINLLSVFTIPINFAKKIMPDTYKGFNKDIRNDEHGEFAIGDTLYNHNRIFNEVTRPNLVFSIYYNPSTGEIVPDDIGITKKGYIELQPHKNGDGTHKYHAWRWSRQKIKNENYNLIVLPTASGGYEIYTKIREFSTTTLKDIITNISNGDTEFKALFNGRKLFDYPKASDLLKTLLGALSETKSPIILDFFSGSATTAHAVMQLNAEDGGNRKFIMVQLPEPCDEKNEAFKAGYKTICEIGKERIRRAGESIKKELLATPLRIDEEPKKIPDIGFKVLKLATSNLKKWDTNPVNLEQALIDSVSNYVQGRSELDVVYEIMLKYGIELKTPLEKLTLNSVDLYLVGGELLICLADSIPLTIAHSIVNFKNERQPENLRVVFKDNGFENDCTKTNIKEILKQGNIAEFVTI